MSEVHNIRFEMAGIDSNGSRLIRTLDDERYFTRWGWVTVPRGTLSDGASIPRVFWVVRGMNPWGEFFPAALLHDFLYKIEGGKAYPRFNRADADLLFLDEMEKLGVRADWRVVMYSAVRAFGWRNFRKE